MDKTLLKEKRPFFYPQTIYTRNFTLPGKVLAGFALSDYFTDGALLAGYYSLYYFIRQGFDKYFKDIDQARLAQTRLKSLNYQGIIY